MLYNKNLFNKVLIVLSVSSFLALFVITFQYSLIAGTENFLKVLLARGYDRSFFLLPQIWSGFEYKNLIIYYLASFYLPIALFLLLFIRIIKGNIFGVLRNLSETEIVLLYLAIFPVVVHHLFLMKWTTEHFYSIIKASVFFSFLSAILLSKIFTEITNKKVFLFLLIVVTISTLLSSILTYEAVFARGTEYSIFKNAGLVIRNHANDSDVVFASTNNYIYPQIIFYSKRNILRVANTHEAKDWLKKHRRKTGMIFYFDDTFHFIRFKKVFSEE